MKRWRLLIGAANAVIIMAMVAVLLIALLRWCAAETLCVMGAAGDQIVRVTRVSPVSEIIAFIIVVLFFLCAARWVYKGGRHENEQ